MTKISELNSIPGNVGDSDLFPGVQSGSTYKVSASQLKSYISGGGSSSSSGTTKLTGATSTVASPVIQRDLAYGIPKALELVEAGTGYDNSLNSQVVLCHHQNLTYESNNHGVGAQYDAKEYIARGLAVRISVSSGIVSNPTIVNPGQMYRIGDTLAVSHFKSSYSGGGSAAQPTTFAIVRVTDIEPFIIGNVSTNHQHMGGGSPWVASSEYGGAANNLSNTMSTRVNPQTSTSPSANDALAMELDWTAPVYVRHTATTTEAAPNYTEGSSSNIEGGVAGIDYGIVGYDGIASPAFDFWGTNSQYISQDKEENISSQQFYYQVNVGVPGLWFLCSTSVVSYAVSTTSSVTPPSFTCSDAIDNSPHSAVSMWPTSKHFLPQYQLGSIRVNGAPYMSTQAHVVAPPDPRGALSANLFRRLDINNGLVITKNDVDSYLGTAHIKNIDTAAYGFWDKSGAGTNNSARQTFANNPDRSFLSCYSAKSGTTYYSIAFGQLNSFYLINALDILPDSLGSTNKTYTA